VWGSPMPSMTGTDNGPFRPGDRVKYTSSVYGSTEAFVLAMLTRDKAVVVSSRGFRGIMKLAKKGKKSWYDVTLHEVVNSRTPVSLIYVDVARLVKTGDRKKRSKWRKNKA